ncbi:hypothetical protein CKA32_004293 [Geitlerinema sp. FC II]|nr:hypothetical protein CKA32_004293 [Geitlerinema sp. FC II]
MRFRTSIALAYQLRRVRTRQSVNLILLCFWDCGNLNT